MQMSRGVCFGYMHQRYCLRYAGRWFCGKAFHQAGDTDGDKDDAAADKDDMLTFHDSCFLCLYSAGFPGSRAACCLLRMKDGHGPLYRIKHKLVTGFQEIEFKMLKNKWLIPDFGIHQNGYRAIIDQRHLHISAELTRLDRPAKLCGELPDGMLV